MDGRRRTDADRTGHRTRLTGRSPGDITMGRRQVAPRGSWGHAGLAGCWVPGRAVSRPAGPHRSVFILAPHGARGAGVADEARLVHRAQRERVLATAQQAVDLDAGAVGRRQDRHVAHGAAADAARSLDGPTILLLIDRVERHSGLASLASCAGRAATRE